MTLRVWIRETGPKVVAAKLGVDPSTVSSWRIGRAFPRAPMLYKIYKASGGRVTYREMVHHFVNATK